MICKYALRYVFVNDGRWDVFSRRRFDGRWVVSWEVELDPFAVEGRCEEPAFRVEADRLGGRHEALLPEDVRAGQRRVAAEVHLDSWGEPAQRVVAVGPSSEKGSLRQIHLARDELHPAIVAGFGQDGDCRRIAREGLIGERVDLPDA